MVFNCVSFFLLPLHLPSVIVCGMPDTFQTWFLVTQLHMWMCHVRLRSESDLGKHVSNEMLQVLMQNMEVRLRGLSVRI